MESKKHSPLPWTLHRNEPIIYGADERTAIADCRVHTPGATRPARTPAVNDANAELIVRAVNSHAELVAALRACLDSMDRLYPNGMPPARGTLCEEMDWSQATRSARAALAKAEA